MNLETGFSLVLADCLGLDAGHSVVDLYNLASSVTAASIPVFQED